MPEIAYWFLLITITLFALPLIFFLGILVTGCLLVLIVSAVIFWFFNQENFDLSIFLIDLLFLSFFLFVFYFLFLLTFATLGMLILKFTDSRVLIRFLNQKKINSNGRLLKYYCKIFFLSTCLLIKKTKWVFWILLPVFIIVLFFTKQKFDLNEFWI